MSPFLTSSDFVDGVRYHVLINGTSKGPFTKAEVLDLHRRLLISDDTPGCITNPKLQPKPPSVASWLPIRTLLPDILDGRQQRNGDTATVVGCPACGTQLRVQRSAAALWRCPTCRARLRVRFSSSGHATAETEVEADCEESGPPPLHSTPRSWNSPYEILGIRSSATLVEIKAAYRSRIQEYHPDKVAALGPELRALAEEKTKLIVEAYQQLTDSHAKE